MALLGVPGMVIGMIAASRLVHAWAPAMSASALGYALGGDTLRP